MTHFYSKAALNVEVKNKPGQIQKDAVPNPILNLSFSEAEYVQIVIDVNA